MCLFSITFGKKVREPKRVLITGFGKFKGVEYNPSWEGVASMDKNKIEWQNQIILLREKIGVVYREVDLVVPILWRCFKPYLAIHVGLNNKAQSFELETNARNTSYPYTDNDDNFPSPTGIMSESSSKITTPLNVKRICEEFNKNPPGPKLEATVSDDAKKYVCEYIYYTSLLYGPALFVHVPENKYSDEEIAKGLQCILELSLKYF